MSELQMTFDHSDIAALDLLDSVYCSAAFDTVDYDILLHKLNESLSVSDTALQWLTAWQQYDQYSGRCGQQSEYEPFD